jgi:omega-hydroxy-beta-dihydromenaquinone-9 sulfotransferase
MPEASSPSAATKSDKPIVETKGNPQGHFCIWHGTSLGIWSRLLASRPPMGWNRWGRMISITALSAVNSVENALESLIFGRRIARQQIEHPPVFILGHWRSGTTLLHNLMAMDPTFTYPNLYHVMYPGHFLLTERIVSNLTGWILPKTRPMDNIPTSWTMSQEDEMALLVMTLISPYLMLAHQGDRSKYGRFFDLTELTPDERRVWKDSFLRFLKKLTIRENKPIVLKSPSHTYRIPILLEMFPNAKFIYIYRDPYAIYSSGMHLRRTLFAENGLGRPVYEGLEEDLLRTYTHCIDRYESTKHLIPPGHLHEVRFEDLEADPLGQMKLVYDRLGLTSWPLLEPEIRKQIPELTRFKKNKFNMDEDLMQRIYAHWRPSFERYGYPSRLPEQEAAAS